MAALKMIERSATVGFAPMASFIAAGTMAGAIDPSFSSTASLEILQLDFTDTEKALPVIKSFPTSERFNRLSWGNSPVASEEYSLGIIAGGLADGSINLWNPAKLIGSDEADSAESVIARSEKHSGSVRGLEFSIISPNLLASGGDDGDLYIWDVKNPAVPTHYPKLRAQGGSAQGELSYVSWNRKVQPILASTSLNGTSVVWDLRKQKPVLSFTDPTSRRRCSALQWNPENATQLVVASDDDRSPSLQVWDLRNSVSPLKEFTGHTKGVLGMAWCPIDSSLLLTCGKDNLTLCWDTISGEILYELPASSNWNFDVQWSPRTPGVLSTSSFDGNISIYNIEACSRTESFGREIQGMTSTETKRAPKWLKRPVGVSFGFGGKLITFGSKKGGAGGVAGPTASEIQIHNLVTEEELVAQSTEFESAINGAEKPALRIFCDAKAKKAGSEDDRETWSFLKVMFDDDARRKLLTHLNFEVAAVESEVQEGRDDLAEELEPVQAEEPESADGPEQHLSPLDDGTLIGTGEEDFFDNIQTPKTPQPQVSDIPRVDELTLEPTTGDENGSLEPESEGEGFDETGDLIQRALVVGDFKAAVQYCLNADRVADALILAYVGGSTLWESTQSDYIKRASRSYLKVLSAVVNNDLNSLVETRPLKAWKETLALLCTYARSEDWTLLSDALAARLDAAHETQAATFCYICSGNIEKAADIWSRSLETITGGRNYVAALQNLMEKVVVLGLATGQKRLSASMARLINQYGELLVSQGLLTTAREYLSLVPADESPVELSILQDRIYGSGDVQGEPPSVPWDPQPLQTDTQVTSGDLMRESYQESDGTSSYYQPPLVPSPHSFQGDARSGGIDPPQRPYPPMEAPTAYYTDFSQTRVTATGYQGTTSYQGAAAYPPQQPGPFNLAASNLGSYYTANSTPPAETWYPPTASTDRQTFTPAGVPPQPFTPVQPFTPSAPAQTFTPSLPAQTFMPSVPSQTFVPSLPSQPFVPNAPPPQIFTPVAQQPTSVAAPPVQTFMPVSPGRPSAGQGPTNVASPQLSSAPPSTAPPAPPLTVQSADTSNVSSELQPVVITLSRLYNETSEAGGGSRVNPARKREIDNNSKKLGALFHKLNTADISANASSKLIQLCQALDMGNYPAALQVQVDLTTSDWDECSVWLTALKQMIKVRQTLR